MFLGIPVREWITGAILLMGLLLVGIVVERVVMRWFARKALQTPYLVDDLFVKAFRGWVWAWFFILGLHLGLLNLTLPPKISSFFSHLIVILFIFAITIPLSRLAGEFINLRMSGEFRRAIPRASVFVTLTRLFVLLIGTLVALHTLGISISPILAGLGIGSLAVALALQDTLSNLFSGLHIIASRQIRIGDFISLASGVSGFVVDITWRNVTLRELPNNLIIVPNNELSKTIVKNYSLPTPDLAVPVDVTVAYGTDMDKVERVTLDVAESAMRTLSEPLNDKPRFRIHTLGESGVAFTVVLRCHRYEDQFLLKHNFLKLLLERYAQEGIEIPYPTRRVLIDKEGMKG